MGNVDRRGEPAAPASGVVPSAVRTAAAWSWRLLVIAGAAALVLLVMVRMRLLVFPLVVALLLAAGLQPSVARLRHWGVSRGLSAALVFVGGLAVVVGVFTLLATLLTRDFSTITANVQGGLSEIRRWLATGPLHVDDAQVATLLDQAKRSLAAHRGTLATGAIQTATVAGELIAGALLSLFATFFFLYDGRGIWTWVVRLLPRSTEDRAVAAGERAWVTLVSYVRGQVIIAAVDAIGVTVVLLALRVPLAAPLGIIVFIGAFVPIVGALLSGSVAVLVALVAHGVLTAVLVLAAILAVQQIESHVLQPLIMGKLVRLHPLAVVLAVTGGALLAGISGAVIAVPTVATINAVVVYLVRGVDVEDEPHPLVYPDPGGRHPPEPPEAAAGDPAVGETKLGDHRLHPPVGPGV